MRSQTKHQKYLQDRWGGWPKGKWKEIKQQPRTAGPGNMLGSCLISFHFLWAILSTSTVILPLPIAKTIFPQTLVKQQTTFRPHTVLFSEVTLDENVHPFWARGMLGEGLDHMWSEYEQIPASPFWEKLEKPLFYYKKHSRLSPQKKIFCHIMVPRLKKWKKKKL